MTTAASITLVIAPVDDSPAARAGARHAALLAQLLRVPLQLVHVMPLAPAELSDVPANRTSEEDRDRSQRHMAARDVFASARQAIGPTLAPPPEEIMLEDAGFVRHPARIIIDHAHRQPGCLLVIGARHLSEVGKFMAGSFSDAVIHEARCPVTLVHPEVDHETIQRIGRVLLPVDGSRHGERAARLAGELARSAGAPVEMLFCHPGEPPPHSPGVSESAEIFSQARQHLGNIPAGIAERAFRCNDYGEAIADYADRQRDNPVIVMGRRGQGAWREKLLGSVSHRVISLAHCPVTVTV
ncbi:universal stress protein [Billgrantia saliphila]|uniref:universal stress protein n=1 Tax=Billgrantia saliphila TaxID=1848458 RepID=UPI000CE5469F|nr:universal stress protein [Halomonas saliphila]